MDKTTIAHELGHAICAEVQDKIWYPTGLSFKEDDTAAAYCYCDKKKNKKTYVNSPHSKSNGMMNLGGLFGELLWHGKWSPWSARADIDEFVSLNEKSKGKLKQELDDWMWVDDDKLSFRFCTQFGDIESRRSFRMDTHDTARRLPIVWEAYLDFCDRIDKKAFIENVDYIDDNDIEEVESDLLKKIMKEIILK